MFNSGLLKFFRGCRFWIIALPLISFADSGEMPIAPKTFFFKGNGNIPNNSLPLLLYKGVIPKSEKNGAEFLEKLFYKNAWIPMWRWQIFNYTHYHPNTHECVGVASGNAVLELGGENGIRVELERGDVVVLPAGVGHKQISASRDFLLVGAYPPKMSPVVYLDDPALLESAKRQICKVPVPQSDPVNGKYGALMRIYGL